MSYRYGKDNIHFCPFCGFDGILHFGQANFGCPGCGSGFCVVRTYPIREPEMTEDGKTHGPKFGVVPRIRDGKRRRPNKAKLKEWRRSLAK